MMLLVLLSLLFIIIIIIIISFIFYLFLKKFLFINILSHTLTFYIYQNPSVTFIQAIQRK